MTHLKLFIGTLLVLNGHLGLSACVSHSSRPLDKRNYQLCDTPQVGGFYEVQMIEGQKTFGAACLDGSVPNYYFRPGFVDSNTGEDGTDKFFIFFEGGGWCAGLTEPVSPSMDTCFARSKTNLGSSLYDSPYMFTDDGYFSTDPEVNSVMYNWNSVYVRYCDGSSYSSYLVNPVSVNNVNLYFRGIQNVKALLQDLLSNYGLMEATQVVVGGCSAGGLASYIHAQYIYEEISRHNSELEYFAALPDSGFFLEYETNEKYVTGMQWVFENQNCTSGMNQQCIEAHTASDDTWKCIFAQETAPYINVPVFALQSRFDSWQLTYILGNTQNNTLVNQYGQLLTTTFNQTYLKTNTTLHGGLLDSCYHHCGEWDDIAVNGLDSTEMFYDMFYHKTQQIFWFQNDPYPCLQCCA